MKQYMILLAMICLLIQAANGCVYVWNASPDTKPQELCPVQTTSGRTCSLPFTYNNRTFTTCTTGGPSNPSRLPQCITTSGTWSVCSVPTTAYVSYVTTKTGGTYKQNGASVSGGTLVWIYGQRFARNSFSTSPSSATSNKIVLQSQFASFDCELHADRSTETQITCWTPAMPEDTYTVLLSVNGAQVPYYQYADISTAVIRVTKSSTPYIESIQPLRGVPSSLVTLEGDFKTECYSRDVTECSEDGAARITRVLFGPQLCELINQTANTVYFLNSTRLNCQLSGTTVALFNASMIVSENFGRAQMTSQSYFVTPNELIYNYQTYAEIDGISPAVGSTEGGTDITITGKFQFHSDSIPAHITVGNKPCKVTSFDGTNQLATVIKCETEKDGTPPASENKGNRGILITRDNVLTTFANLGTATQSASAVETWLDEASFVDDKTQDVTVWLNGFLTPGFTSNYEFSVSSNGATKLYLSTDSTKVNEQLVASFDLTTSTKQVVLLESSKVYYIRAIASRRNGGLKVSLNAKMLDSSLNSQSITDKIKTEIQEVAILSTIVPESASISYGGVLITNGTNEVQELTISSVNFDDMVLSFDGANTKRISYGSTASEVKQALMDLPTLYRANINVKAAAGSNGELIYTIEFTSALGNVPEIRETLGLVSFNNTELVAGVESNKQVQVKIQDAYTQLFDPANETLASIKGKISEVFGIRCPSSIIRDDAQTSVLFDYENECEPDEQPLIKTAFCGFCSRKNQAELFSGVKVPLSFGQLCFAYKTTSTPISRISYNVLVDGDLSEWTTTFLETLADGQWHYTCVDVYQDTLTSLNTDSGTYPPGRYTLLSAYLYPVVNDVYIDAVSLKTKVPLGYGETNFESSRRVFPQIQMVHDTLIVTRDAVNNALTLAYRPNNCTINLNQTETRQSSFIVTSVSSASGPITGTFNLTWNGSYIGEIRADSSAYTLKNLLQAVKGLENVNVKRTQDCAGFKWTIEWFYGGNKQEIQVSSQALSGNSPSIAVKTVVDGGVEFNPIPGDMLRTVHNKPQVSVVVNGIPSKCSTSCTHEQTSAATPIVNSITVSSGAVTISGSGFDAVNTKNNLVFIGTTACSVTAATSTSITCVPTHGPVGTYPFRVQILGKGYAIMNSNTNYTFSLVINSFTPSIVGSGGGVVLSISGSGFSKQSQVKIDNILCSIKSVSYNQIECITPTNPTNTNKQVNIEVVDGTYSTIASTQLNIDNVNVPQVTSVSPSNGLSVLGGETIVILGSGFNTSMKQVTIGTKLVSIQSMNSTAIVITSPKMSPGQYQIIIPSGILGNAKVTTLLEYTLYVSSFTPTIGSIRGGTLVTIYGDGFNQNCSLNKVAFGDALCLVKSCTSKWIQCETSSAYHVHKIDNTGINPSYGTGYQWTKQNINVNKGDSVLWTWSPPGSVNNVQYMIEQVEDASSVQPNGFSSGNPTARGSYTYQFNTEGTYFYWSGYVDSSKTISLRGVITVGPTQNLEESLKVSMDDIDAQKCVFPFTYNGQSYSSCTNVNFGYNWCSPTKEFSGQVLKCNAQSQPSTSSCPGSTLNCPSAGTPNDYHMQFLECNVPTVSSISRSNGSFDDAITISGNGFSTTQCENSVFIGHYKCPITQSSATSITCKIGSNSGLLPNIPYRVEVNVANQGNAIQNSWYRFRFIPKINSITPSIGSQFGGLKVTIEGDGFDSSATSVSLDTSQASLSSISYDQISFITQEDSIGVKSVKVRVNGVEALCGLAACTFEYSSNVAPTVTTVSPTTVSGPTTLTITGTNFGTNSSAAIVLIGSRQCSIVSFTSTSLTCSLSAISLGPQSVSLIVDSVGSSSSRSAPIVTGVTALSSITPSSGSSNGGTLLTIVGNGFDLASNTRVSIGSQSCVIQSVTVSQIKCLTPSGTGVSLISIESNGVTYPTSNFTYDSSVTPRVTSISPSSGSTSQMITLTGLNFGSNSAVVSVDIGSVSCTIVSVSNTQIQCTTGSNIAGAYNVRVRVDNVGYSNQNIQYSYNLALSSLSDNRGSYAGGLEVTLNGQGFDGDKSVVTICSVACPIVSFIGTTQVACRVPAQTYSASDKQCSLEITINSVTASLSFTYVSSLTPSVTNVTPTRGGTAGGTLITVTGSGFPLTQTDVQVTIADSPCEINTLTTTVITCYTGSYSQSSIKASVKVFINRVGLALSQGKVDFEYIDLWSSVFTWGGESVPREGELVLIGPGQTIYFDAVTPILKGLIIQGGTLIFDDNQDVNLNAEYIVILDNGKLQVGTEIKPFTHKATITMYGSLRSIELPIYGSKVIALRNGTLDLHGQPVGNTWVYLGQTASALSSSLTLLQAVQWKVGSKIVIATTSDSNSQGETEVRTITAISADKKTLTLDKPLKFTHLSESRTVGGVTVHKRAEIGLLSRNVIFNAINDNSWNSLRSASACPDGFDPGEFATMTCFLGRYGEELGSDEFGATIMIHTPTPNKIGAESVIARISNVELTHVGQAFRLGRYPIHFHLIGDSPSSYVKECAIYESFNRAVNIHGTNYVRVERTVIYNIMGGAFFLEDGIEIGNVFDGNLAVFVKVSSSGINEDGTPAAFWATNPNNTYINNAVAGSTHFGYWYRILEHPEGPSYTPNYCPRKIPFGRFFNNTAHSIGRFGLWVFPAYTPTVTGSCWDTKPSVARYEHFTSYGCDKGAEWVEAGPLQFNNMIAFDHSTTGIETKTIANHDNFNPIDYIPFFYDSQVGSLVSNSIIIGNSLPTATASTSRSGLIIAWERGQFIKNVSFINFPDVNSVAIMGTVIDGRCLFGCGGWETQFSELKFTNVRQRTIHRWNWDVVMKDLDGTLSGGKPGSLVLFNGNITAADSRCKVDSKFAQGTVCEHKDHIRFAFNNLNSDNVILIYTRNEKNVSDEGLKLKKRLTNPKGFMMSLEVNQTYFIEFDQYNYPTNISYTGGFYSIKQGDWVIIKHEMNKKPDQVSFNRVLAAESMTPLTIDKNQNTDWYWDNNTRHISYLICNKAITPMLDVPASFSARKCRYEKCIMPGQPSQRLPAASRPPNALYWSNLTTWLNTPAGFGGFGGVLPKDEETVIIQDTDYVVADIPLPRLKRIQIEGYLEFDDSLDNSLTASEIFINGGQLIIGWENKPFTHKAEIVLTGSRTDEELVLPNGFDSMGNKAIGVYGGMSLHGVPRKPSWTTLNSTALKGTNTLVLNEAVDWLKDEEIVVSTTNFDPFQTETFKILSVRADKKTITLNSSLLFTHISDKETYANGKSFSVSAGVGLLTRNIKIVGGEYTNQWNEKMGSRIIVTDYSYNVFPEGSSVPTSIYYRGYARLSDVEFVHGGQDSRNADDDFKYAILYSNLGAYDNRRPSYVRNCAFHNGFSAAIGILDSSSIPIESNVVHHTLGFAMRIKGDSNIIRKNLVVLNVWSSTYIPKNAPFDVNFMGAISAHQAESIILEDNLIAGSERIGLLYRGSPCSGGSLGKGLNHSIARNHIYGSVSGATIFPGSVFGSLSCISISGFTLYKNLHWGIYYQGNPNILIEDNILVDNTAGIFTQVLHPVSLNHDFENKYAIVRNNLLVGRSASFNCQEDITPSGLFVKYAKVAKSERTISGGYLGIYGCSFADGSNGAPFKPWRGSMTYNALGGLMTIENTTFARYGTQCGGEIDAIITNSPSNEDGQHPMRIRNVNLYRVENSSKIYFFRPNRDKINPSDCVDMDCDGLKKNLISDEDGSFLGRRGAIISQSEYGWGTQERGLGDYRIPLPAFSAPNGTLLPSSAVYSKPGIVRDENLCSYRADWQAYECYGLEYKMLIIESMDVDTEVRRLSPVAIISDNKYIDLINGPQDHGWCNGYTCQKRISTFIALVAANKSYDVYLSSTPPNHLRFRVINADANFKIRLSMYYFTSNSINVYKGATLVDPNNADRSKGYLVLKDPNVGGVNYMPQIGDLIGANFMSRGEKKLYFAIDGSDYVDLKISPEIFVTFGVQGQTADTFFQSANVVNNIAILLGVPSNMIRRVQLVSARNTTRVARQNSVSYIQVVIADDPVSNGNDSSAYDAKVHAINQLAARIVNQAHIGFLQEQATKLFNLSIDTVSYDQTPSDIKTNATVLDRQVQVEQVFKLVTIQEFSGCRAQSPCDQQAIVAVQDKFGNVIRTLGANGFPWAIKATLFNSTSQTSIILETEVKVVDGFAKFTKLGLSHSTQSFSIEFGFAPIVALNQSQLQPFAVNSTPASVTEPILGGLALDQMQVVNMNTQFSLRFALKDAKSGIQIPNIAWKGLTWTSKLSLYSLSMWQSNGTLNATFTQASLSSATGITTYSNLSINEPGMYLLKADILSSNAEYNLTTRSNIIRVLASGRTLAQETTEEPSIKFVFEGDFDALQASGELDAYKAMFYNYITNVKQATITGDVHVYKGSVGFAFNVQPSSSVLSGLSASSNQTTQSAILPGLAIKYISLFGNSINVSAQAVATSQKAVDANGGAVAGGVIGGLAAVALVAVGAGLLFKYKEKLVTKKPLKNDQSPRFGKDARQPEIKVEETPVKQSNPKRRLLDDDVTNDYILDAKFYNESVTVARNNQSPAVQLTLPSLTKQATNSFDRISRENTKVSMSEVHVL